ncbi:SseB family protein [Kitasatospora viridis]|uniref:SseB family protein n=1 Tax=Kitasatospora viridis TaxID=281105 RepID=UPI001FECB3F2|nr:SseB family protein [Kitasatospora viridis]
MSARLVALHDGTVGTPEVVEQIRDSHVLVPTAGGEPIAAELDGVEWIYAFSGAPALARFAKARGLGPEVPCLTVSGAQLLELAGAGLALDVAGPAPLLLPPGACR